MNIRTKIPNLETVMAVYSIITAMLYFPAFLHYLWKLPSWLLFSSFSDLSIIYFYMVTVNFIESILVLMMILAFSIVLPARWFRDRFVSKGVMLTVFLLGFLIYLGRYMWPETLFPWGVVRLSPLIFAAIVAIVFILDEIPFLRKLLEEIANRFTIFLYILIPISILSAVIVLFRNLF